MLSWLGIKGTLVYTSKEGVRFSNKQFLNLFRFLTYICEHFLQYTIHNTIEGFKGFGESFVLSGKAESRHWMRMRTGLKNRLIVVRTSFYWLVKTVIGKCSSSPHPQTQKVMAKETPPSSQGLSSSEMDWCKGEKCAFLVLGNHGRRVL